MEEINRHLGIAEQTYYRLRKEYGGLKISQARKIKDLEKENTLLKKAVAYLTLVKLILQEALEGNYQALTGAEKASRIWEDRVHRPLSLYFPDVYSRPCERIRL